jgi:DNA-binding CsgD family transcriptional regulator/tetratricopeptide (TPR) repeat protein
VAAQWRLVGRDNELVVLRAALVEADTHAVVLSGVSGVGKTRLMTELVAHAAERGWSTQWAVGTRGIAGVPFGAFAHLLPACVAATGRLEVMRRAGDELRRMGAGRPILVAVDDAHLLDEDSAALTHLLASTGLAFVVATVRSGERAPGAVTELGALGRTRCVEVGALSFAEVGHLLGAVLGGQLDTTTQHRLWDASQGNALFLHELVLIGLERGSLAERDGVWSWVGELACSDRLTELVEDRLAGLDQRQRAAVQVLAVGEPVPSQIFDAVVGSQVVRELHHRGLLGIAAQERRLSVRLAHPLYGETVRAGLGAVRRRTIYRQLADALTAAGLRRREDVLRASVWRLGSGRPAEPALLMAGARQARAMFDHRQAERLARAAIDEGAGTEAWVMLADALQGQGRYDEARAVIEDGLPLGAAPAVVAEWATVASSVFFWGLGNARRAEEITRRAEEAMAPGPEHDLLVTHRALLTFFHGRPAEAAAATEPVLARQSAGDEIAVQARIAAAPALAVLGRCDSALRLVDQGMLAAIRLIDERPRLLGELLAVHAVTCWLSGRYPQMEDLATAAYQHVIAERTHDLRGLWALLLGRAALAAGRARTARLRLREACALFSRHDPGGLLPWALGALARAAALLGDKEDARRALVEQQRRLLPAVRIFDWEMLLSQAWTSAAHGEHSRARGLAREAADIAAATGMGAAELDALHDGLRLGDTRVVERMAQVAGRVDSVLAPVFVAHGRALAAGDGDALDNCATRFGECGAPLLAAEAAAEAAQRYQQDGRSAARFAALSRSQQWASACEGARTPSLRRTGGPPALGSLTGREREIAELAARGLSKREMAECLDLSVRTVGNHLNHIYSKAGISGRAELAVLLGSENTPV